MAAPAKKKRRRNEDNLRLVVGTVAIGLVAAFMCTTVLIEGRHFGPGVEVTMELGRIGKLGVGTAVRVSGKKIGQIERVAFASRDSRVCPVEPPVFGDAAEAGHESSAPRILLTLWIKRSERDNLRSNAEFFVNQGSILAPQYIEVLPPPREAEPGPLLKDGAVVCGVTPAPTDRLLTRSLENMKILRAAVEMQRPAFAEFAVAAWALWDTLQSLPTERGQVSRIVAHVREAMHEGDLLLEELAPGQRLPRLRAVVARFRKAMKAVEGDITEMRGKVVELQANITRLGGLLPAAKRKALLAGLATLRGTLDEARRIMKVTGQITQAVADAEGTIGLMLADRELFDDFKTMSRILKERPFNTMGVPPAVVEEP